MGTRLVADRDDRSPQFDAVMASSHRVAARIELLIEGQLARAVQGYGDSLPFTEGSVTQSRSQFARQSLTVTLADAALIPLGGSLLNINGAELRVWSGAYVSAEPRSPSFYIGVYSAVGSSNWVSKYDLMEELIDHGFRFVPLFPQRV